MKPSRSSTPRSTPESPPPQGSFRSGVVARMAKMPVATLRIWEQRYRAVRPASAPSGHRLYSPADVQRVLLLRQLTAQGHAIGSIAALDSVQLQQLQQVQQAALGEATRVAGAASPAPTPRQAPLRLVVVGPALAARLQRAELARAMQRPLRVVVVAETLAEAAAAAPGGRASPRQAADMLLWLAPELPPEAPPELQAARSAWRARHAVVLYRFAGAAARRALAVGGVQVLREPADDAPLAALLRPLAAGERRGTAVADAPTPSTTTPGIAPRRFDDAALTTMAGLAPTLACECPRHVAELLMQLASFEAYSAACASRDPADAALHAYLQQVAGASRALFETALERVARHEGLALG